MVISWRFSLGLRQPLAFIKKIKIYNMLIKWVQFSLAQDGGADFQHKCSEESKKPHNIDKKSLAMECLKYLKRNDHFDEKASVLLSTIWPACKTEEMSSWHCQC